MPQCPSCTQSMQHSSCGIRLFCLIWEQSNLHECSLIVWVHWLWFHKAGQPENPKREPKSQWGCICRGLMPSDRGCEGWMDCGGQIWSRLWQSAPILSKACQAIRVWGAPKTHMTCPDQVNALNRCDRWRTKPKSQREFQRDAVTDSGNSEQFNTPIETDVRDRCWWPVSVTVGHCLSAKRGLIWARGVTSMLVLSGTDIWVHLGASWQPKNPITSKGCPLFPSIANARCHWTIHCSIHSNFH